MINRCAMVLCLTSLLFLSAGVAHATSYTFYDLGATGDNTGTGSGSFAYGINSSNTVVGRVFPTSGSYAADWTLSGSTYTRASIPMLNGTGTTGLALAVNNSGLVTGLSASTAPNGNQAFLYDIVHSTNYNIGQYNILPNQASSRGVAINSTGQVTGYSSAGQYFWDGNTGHAVTAITYTGFPGGGVSNGSTYALNDSGVVVGLVNNTSGGWAGPYGNVSTKPLVWQNGTFTDISSSLQPLLPGVLCNSAALAINNSGEIVGSAWYLNVSGLNEGSAFLYKDSTHVVNLGGIGGGYTGNGQSEPLAINTNGTVVGFATASGGLQHAFVWTPTVANGTTSTAGMVDLNSLVTIPPSLSSAGYYFWSATGINDSGSIVGQMYNGTSYRAFALVGVPEPSTLLLAATGLVGLIACAWRRRKFRSATMFRFCAMVLIALAGVLAAGIVQADVFNMTGGQTSLLLVPVGDAGNAADTTGYGAVGYAYRMGEYDVTIGQYCQFLNAVAKTDTYGLYNSLMLSGSSWYTAGISQSGSSGNYTYAVAGSYNQAANCPIYTVSWGNAARFCNWLHNGQPTGAEGNGTTETGAYTLSGDTSSYLEPRSAGAAYFIPSEDEWYKAAYYKGGGTNAGYWSYQTRNNTAPVNTLDPAGTNNANLWGTVAPYYADPVNLFTPVGYFAGSPGPYGTFDQAGNISEWDEAIIGTYRGTRGGNYMTSPVNLISTYRTAGFSPSGVNIRLGFRVAALPAPEPGTIAMLLGFVGMALLYWRRAK